MTPELARLLRALALYESRLHVRNISTESCHRDGEPWPCEVRQAAEAVEAL